MGGTFDPVHLGHVSVLEQVVLLLGADSGRLVPTYEPPHRSAARAPVELRLEMARAAVADHARLEVDDIEAGRADKSYTFDTLMQWRALDPDAETYLVLGADAARLIPEWHRSQELLSEGHFVLVNRSGVACLDVVEARSLGFLPDRTRLLEVVSPAINATSIRDRLRAHQSVAGMVDARVLAIIEREQLYSKPSSHPVA